MSRVSRTMKMLGVNVLDHPEHISAVHRNIESYRPFSVPELGYEVLLIKREKPQWLTKGLLLIIANRNFSTGALIYSLQAVFKRSDLTVDVVAVGEGDVNE